MSRLRVPTLAWAAVGAVLAVTQYVANALHAGDDDWLRWPGGPRFFAGWRQFDAGEFLGIAERGYWFAPGARSSTSFFPLYPLLIRAAHLVIDDWLVAAVVVSAMAGWAAVALFWIWTDGWELEPTVRRFALGALLLYPWAWFLYGVPFADATFVALVIGAFLLVERDRLLLAGVVGAFATAARPTGLFLAPALVLLALERARVLLAHPAQSPEGWWRRLRLPVVRDRAAFRARHLLPLLALVGVVAYSTYLGARFGRPITWITDQSLYNGTGPKTWFKAGLIKGWVTWDDPWRTFAQTVEAALAVGVLVSVPSVGRRFGWGYGIFVLALVAMPSIATRDFNSTGRYLLAAFPVVLVLAERLAARPRPWRIAWLVGSGALLLALNAAFAQSQMVS